MTTRIGALRAASARRPARANDAKYDPALCVRIVERMAEGASQAEVAREIGIARSAWYRWRDQHPEFAQAVQEGLWRAQGWWEREGRVNLGSREFNHVLWFMNMKNRFPADWRDRQEVAASHQVTLGDLVMASLEGIRAKARSEG